MSHIDTSPAALRKLAIEYLGSYENTKVMLDTIRAIAAEKEAQPRPTDGELWDDALSDRDRYHGIADKLANAIAAHLGIDIGEHSNLNCPWLVALEALEQHHPEQPLEMVAPADVAQTKLAPHTYSQDMKPPIHEQPPNPEWKMEDPARFLAPADVPLPEPLFLLHCGALYDGEQDDWDVEANSGKAADALAREHPNETVWLHSSYDAHQYAEAYAKAAVAAERERWKQEAEKMADEADNRFTMDGTTAEWLRTLVQRVCGATTSAQKGTT